MEVDSSARNAELEKREEEKREDRGEIYFEEYLSRRKARKQMPDLEEFGEDEDEDDEWEVVQETHCHLELPDCPVKVQYCTDPSRRL